MSRLDDELRKALAREEPPAGFESRLLARLAQEPAAKPAWWRRGFGGPLLRVAWAGALAIALVVSVRYQQQARERERGEEAKRQLMTALHVTSGKLQAVHERVRALSIDHTVE